MVKQRFGTLFRPRVITFAKVFGAILGYHLFRMAREYFQYLPLSLVELLMGAGGVLLTIALLCWLWAWGEWSWSKLDRLVVSAASYSDAPEATGSLNQSGPTRRSNHNSCWPGALLPGRNL